MTTTAPEIGMNWNAKALRVTAFFRLGWDVPAPTSRSFWKAACSDDPEVSERGLGHSQDVGRWNNGKLLVKTEPAGGDMFRIDMIWETAWYREDGITTLEAFSALINNLVKSPQFPVMSRLAIAANVGWPVPDRANAYKKLSTLLPRIHFDEQIREAMFRYNRQGPSKYVGEAKPADILINRVSTWSCQQVTQLMPFFVYNSVPDVTTSRPFEIVAACDQDLSTDAEHDGKWDSVQSLAWIDCLIEEARKIIEKGDPL